MGFHLNKFRFLILMPICAVLFQNCLSPEAEQQENLQKPSVTLEAGDTGYEGKTTVYATQNLKGLCQDGTDLYSQIDVNHAQNIATLTRDNCKKIDPISISLNDLDLLPHNLENFTDNLLVYELYEGKFRDGELFAYCRGQADDQGTGRVVVDIILRQVGPNQYMGRVAAGKYNRDGELIDSHDSGYVEHYRWDLNDDGKAYFAHQDSAGNRLWFFHIRKGTETKGSLNYENGVDAKWGSIWNFPCLRFKK